MARQCNKLHSSEPKTKYSNLIFEYFCSKCNEAYFCLRKIMTRLLTYYEINPLAWKKLVDESPYATWFQTQEAYQFYAANKQEMTPFACGIERDGELRAVCVGYVTKERSRVKQFYTRRAIIIGGPLIADSANEDDIARMLYTIRQPEVLITVSTFCPTWRNLPIYIETRNFHDYSRWKEVFEACGFDYQPHLNFHIDTTTEEIAQSNIGKHRWKYIRLSIRDGATMVENPTIEQVRECYELLKELYSTRVKTPLFSWNFFEKLYHQPNARYLLVELEGKIVGGTVCVCLPNKALYEWFVCGNDYYRKGIRPSSVATWYGMQYAARNGYPLFDLMGAGKPDEPYGVRDFKAEFGGKLVEHGRFFCIRKPLLYWMGKLGVKILKKR